MITNILALCALAVSVYAVYQTQRLNRRQAQLIDREAELTRLLTHQADRQISSENIASISARTYNDGKNWKLRIFNSGNGAAHGVTIVLDDKNQFISQAEVDRKFPMKKMEPGQSVNLNMFVHMQSPSKESIVLTWKDASSENRKNEVEITL